LGIAHFSHVPEHKTVEVEERPSLAHPYGDQPTVSNSESEKERGRIDAMMQD